MPKIKVIKTPGASALVKTDGGANMFKDTLQYPNLVFNSSTIGIINSDHLGTDDAAISSSLNPVDEQHANVEAEKGEMLVKPNLDGFYKINGKTHTDGGTPLAVPEGSFIFSNAKSLAFTKKDKELFQFKSGGDLKKNNTPARVIAREVDPKKYNTLMAIINDDKADSISKDSAALMLQKHQEKMGQVALLQEVKKKLKDGLPNFAVLPTGIDQDQAEDMAETQYAKMGGKINSSYGGGGPIKGYRGDKKDKSNASIYPDDEWQQFANDIGFKGNNVTEFQNALFNMNGEAGGPDLSSIIIGEHQNFGDPNEPPSRQSMYNWLDGRLGHRWDKVRDAYYSWKNQQRIAPQANDYSDHTAQDYADPSDFATQPTAPQAPAAGKPKSPDVMNQRGWDGFHFAPNSAELLSIAAPGLQAIASPTYYDMLSQRYTPNIRLDRIDNKQQLGDIKEMAAMGTQEAFNAAPDGNLNYAQAVSASIRANAQKSMDQSNAGMTNANTQIANQESMINAQQKVQDNDFNIQAIHQTYNNNILSQQRRNEQLSNGFSQVVNNGLAVRKNLDTLGYMATATALPSMTTMKDKDGNPMVFTDPKTGEKYTQLGVPLAFNENRIPTFDPRFGGLDSFLTNQYSQQGQSSDLAAIATKELRDSYVSKDPKRIYAAAQAYDKVFGANGKGNSAAQNALSQLMQKFSQ